MADKLVKKNFPDFLKSYNSLEYPIMKVEAIRYMWLYVYGGIYMDLDIVVVKPLDDLFYFDVELYLSPSGNVSSYLTNSFMASKPHRTLWLRMIAHMKQPKPRWAWGKHMTVMNTTGPVALNYVVKNEGYTYLALSAKKVMPCSVCNIDSCDIGDAYLRPLIGSSWVAWDTKAINFVVCNWRTLVTIIIIILVTIILYFIVMSLIRKFGPACINRCGGICKI